jgi:hypothetical protein
MIVVAAVIAVTEAVGAVTVAVSAVAVATAFLTSPSVSQRLMFRSY